MRIIFKNDVSVYFERSRNKCYTFQQSIFLLYSTIRRSNKKHTYGRIANCDVCMFFQ